MFVNPSGLTVIVEETATSMAFRNGLRRRPARVHRRVGSLRGKFYFGNWRPSAAGPGRNLGSLSLRKLRKTTSLARINSDLELDRTSGNLPTLWRADSTGPRSSASSRWWTGTSTSAARAPSGSRSRRALSARTGASPSSTSSASSARNSSQRARLGGGGCPPRPR